MVKKNLLVFLERPQRLQQTYGIGMPRDRRGNHIKTCILVYGEEIYPPFKSKAHARSGYLAICEGQVAGNINL